MYPPAGLASGVKYISRPSFALVSVCSLQPSTAETGCPPKNPFGFFRCSSHRKTSLHESSSFSMIAARVINSPGTIVSGVIFTRVTISACCFPFLARSPYEITRASFPKIFVAAVSTSAGYAGAAGFALCCGPPAPPHAASSIIPPMAVPSSTNRRIGPPRRRFFHFAFFYFESVLFPGLLRKRREESNPSTTRQNFLHANLEVLFSFGPELISLDGQRCFDPPHPVVQFSYIFPRLFLIFAQIFRL